LEQSRIGILRILRQDKGRSIGHRCSPDGWTLPVGAISEKRLPRLRSPPDPAKFLGRIKGKNQRMTSASRQAVVTTTRH
jgi:hypothetical protein